MLEASSHKPTSKNIINFIKHKWIIAFQMPSLDESSHRMDESSYRMIGNTLTFLEKYLHIDFPDVLQSAATIRSSSPHSAIGCTFFFTLCKFEPTLPGWQSLQQQDKSNESRKNLR